MKQSPDYSFAILDHSPIGHFILDENLVIRFWNHCLEAWTGRSRQELVGHSILESFPHLGEPKYRNRIEPVFHGGPPITFSSQLHKHFLPAPLPGDKKRIQQSVVTALATDTSGSFLALFSIQDVTSLTDAVDKHTQALQQLTIEAEERQQEVLRRKAAEESLREMDRMKNDFISSAAHELNTPLSSILGYAELFQMAGDAISTEKKLGFIGDIIENAENLARIIDDLLDIAHFEQGRGINLDKEPSAPEELISKIVRRFETRKDSHHFQLDLAEGAHNKTSFDPHRIRQVLENIISNAAKYSPADTTISISTEWHESGVSIMITDQGIGMSEKQLAKVFDKFYRADISNVAVRGLGLGMSIVKQIVEQHDGTIKMTSKLNEGTSVEVFLPRCEVE